MDNLPQNSSFNKHDDEEQSSILIDKHSSTKTSQKDNNYKIKLGRLYGFIVIMLDSILRIIPYEMEAICAQFKNRYLGFTGDVSNGQIEGAGGVNVFCGKYAIMPQEAFITSVFTLPTKNINEAKKMIMLQASSFIPFNHDDALLYITKGERGNLDTNDTNYTCFTSRKAALKKIRNDSGEVLDEIESFIGIDNSDGNLKVAIFDDQISRNIRAKKLLPNLLYLLLLIFSGSLFFGSLGVREYKEAQAINVKTKYMLNEIKQNNYKISLLKEEVNALQVTSQVMTPDRALVALGYISQKLNSNTILNTLSVDAQKIIISGYSKDIEAVNNSLNNMSNNQQVPPVINLNGQSNNSNVEKDIMEYRFFNVETKTPPLIIEAKKNSIDTSSQYNELTGVIE